MSRPTTSTNPVVPFLLAGGKPGGYEPRTPVLGCTRRPPWMRGVDAFRRSRTTTEEREATHERLRKDWARDADR